jgi:hypothetical protein
VHEAGAVFGGCIVGQVDGARAPVPGVDISQRVIEQQTGEMLAFVVLITWPVRP